MCVCVPASDYMPEAFLQVRGVHCFKTCLGHYMCPVHPPPQRACYWWVSCGLGAHQLQQPLPSPLLFLLLPAVHLVVLRCAVLLQALTASTVGEPAACMLCSRPCLMTRLHAVTAVEAW